MIAGAGLEGATAKLCTDKDCTASSSTTLVAAEATVDAWNKSIKMVLPPAGCGPPCFVSTENLARPCHPRRPLPLFQTLCFCLIPKHFSRFFAKVCD